jgi:hypothetical protein
LLTIERHWYKIRPPSTGSCLTYNRVTRSAFLRLESFLQLAFTDYPVVENAHVGTLIKAIIAMKIRFTVLFISSHSGYCLYDPGILEPRENGEIIAPVDCSIRTFADSNATLMDWNAGLRRAYGPGSVHAALSRGLFNVFFV